MPAKDYRQQVNPSFASMMEAFKAPEATGLEADISALREEIRQLREDLAPVPSLILTGRQVLDEFKRLNSVANP